jgi:hypothetical protein
MIILETFISYGYRRRALEFEFLPLEIHKKCCGEEYHLTADSHDLAIAYSAMFNLNKLLEFA